MATRVLRTATYLLIAAALIFFMLALCVDFGLREIPIWPGQILELTASSFDFTRVALVFSGMAALLFFADRVRRTA